MSAAWGGVAWAFLGFGSLQRSLKRMVDTRAGSTTLLDSFVRGVSEVRITIQLTGVSMKENI